MKTPNKPATRLRWRPAYTVIALVLLALIVIRLSLNAIVKHYVNKKLNELPGYTGHVDDIAIALWRGAYIIEGLRLQKTTDPAKYPFLRIERADLALQWRALFKGRLVARVILKSPQVNILSTESVSKEPSKDSWTKTVKALIPITINKLEIENGRFDYRNLDKNPPFDLNIHDLQLTATNLANVQKLADPLPSGINFSGIAIGGGRLIAFAKANLLKQTPDFNVLLKLTNVDITSLNPMLEASVKFDVERGKIDVFSKLNLKDSQMDGYVKPFIKDLKVLDVKKDIKKKGGVLLVAKKAIVGLFAKAVQNPKTKKIATVVPLKGNIDNPKTSGWQTFLGVLKNAFIKALHESIGNEVDAKKTT